MQYQVPQFIEVEDKIFGPLTFKQFAYLAGAGGITLIFFTLFPLWLTLILSAPFIALGVALAFYKVNDRPLITVLEHAVRYYLSGKLYLWKQRDRKNNATTPNSAPVKAPPSIPAVSESKLKDLAWSLNIKDREKMGVTSNTPTGFEL